MIALFYWILRLFKRDVAFISAMRRSKIRFFELICADVLLSFGLAFLTVQIFGPTIWPSADAFALQHPGFLPTPLHNFLDYASSEKELTYWLGSINGALYTYVPGNDGREVVSYYSGDSKSPTATIPIITVTTYRNASVYQATLHRFLGGSAKQMLIEGNRTIESDEKSLTSEVIRFRDKPIIVTIDYQTSRYEVDLIVDAQILKPLA